MARIPSWWATVSQAKVRIRDDELDDKEYPISSGDVILVSEGAHHGTVAGPNGMTLVLLQAAKQISATREIQISLGRQNYRGELPRTIRST